MAWVCDYCGSPPAPWSGGQGPREYCSDPSCVSHTPEPPVPPHTLTIKLSVSDALMRDPEAPVEDLVASDASKLARKAFKERREEILNA